MNPNFPEGNYLKVLFIEIENFTQASPSAANRHWDFAGVYFIVTFGLFGCLQNAASRSSLISLGRLFSKYGRLLGLICCRHQRAQRNPILQILCLTLLKSSAANNRGGSNSNMILLSLSDEEQFFSDLIFHYEHISDNYFQVNWSIKIPSGFVGANSCSNR